MAFRNQQAERLAHFAAPDRVQHPTVQTFLRGFFGTTNPIELSTWSPRDVLLHWLRRRLEASSDPEIDRIHYTRTILGTVAEDAHHVHALYRSRMRARYGRQEVDREKLAVATAVSTEAGWLLELNDEMTGIDLGLGIRYRDGGPSQAAV
jgi:hypothetical protein